MAGLSEGLKAMANQILAAADANGITHINAQDSARHIFEMAKEIETIAREGRAALEEDTFAWDINMLMDRLDGETR